jgi:hypothetical protein
VIKTNLLGPYNPKEINAGMVRLDLTLKTSKEEDAENEVENHGLQVQRDIEFTVDEDIYEKTGVKKPRNGEELDSLGGEKLYRYQLDQDIEKIIKWQGGFKKKIDDHTEIRMEDASYRLLTEVHPLGSLCTTNDVAMVTREISWRNTSKLASEIPQILGLRTHLTKAPFIANKRYVEWLTGKPKGPSEAFLKDKAQRKQDSELWDDILHSRLEPTRDEIRAAGKAASKARNAARLKEKEDLKNLNKKKNDKAAGEEAKIAENRSKRKNIEANDFAANRRLPSEDQAKKSLNLWDVGFQENWDFAKNSFGKYDNLVTTLDGTRMSDGILGSDAIITYEGPKFDFAKYIDANDEMAEEFKSYVVETNLKKAAYFLSIQKQKHKKEAKLVAKRKKEEELTRRRRNVTDMQQLAIDAIKAKTAIRVGNFHQKKVEKEGSDSDSEDEDGDDDSLGPDSVSQTTALSAGESLESGSDVQLSEKPADAKLNMKKVPSTYDKFAECLESMKTAYKRCTRKQLRISYKKRSRAFRRSLSHWKTYLADKKKVKRDIMQLRCIFGKPKKKKKDSTVEPEVVEQQIEVDAGYEEVQAAKTIKLREWEKYTEEELEDMEQSERKRLKKMRKKDEEDDAIKDKEKRKAEMQKKIDEVAKEKEKMRKKEGGWFQKMYAKIVILATGQKPVIEMSSVERRKKEAAEAARKMMNEEENFEKAMELLFAFREKQRQAAAIYDDLKKFLSFGIAKGAEDIEYNVDELIRYSRLGLYASVIDVVDHVLNPIHPNATNSDGESAFYTVLKMVMNNEAAEATSDLEVRSCMQKFNQWFSNGEKKGKLDLVLKILFFKGGDVNFRKDDKDVDGTAILHEAAACGSINMIGWLLKRKADFSLKTTNLFRTPLMYAARAGQMDAMLYLLKNGSMQTLNAQDIHGWTALHFAAAFAHPDIASVLLICGADSYARSNKGSQAVDEASSRGRTTMVENIRCFKQPDFMHRRLIEFMEIKYLSKAREVVPDIDSDDDYDDDDDAGDDELEGVEEEGEGGGEGGGDGMGDGAEEKEA